MRFRIAALIPVLAALHLTGCGEEAITRARVPKAEAPSAASPHAGDQAIGEGMPLPKFVGRGLVWTLPSGWTEVAGNGIRLATFVPPGGLETKVTVVSLPSDSGGELANANRWRGQLGLAPTDEAGMAAARTTFATKAGLAKIYDFTGTGEVRTRMIVAAIDTGGTIWFFKLMGEAAATESAHGDFLALIKGLKPDAAK